MNARDLFSTVPRIFALLGVCLFANACQSMSPNTQNLHNQLPQDTTPRMTLGMFQSTVSKGMTKGDVAAAVGSPNMVEKRRGDREVWIYDKVSSESSAASQQVQGSVGVGMGALGVSGGGLVGGGMGAGGGAGKHASVSRTTQKTLTVVIEFVDGVVDDIAYNMTQF